MVSSELLFDTATYDLFAIIYCTDSSTVHLTELTCGQFHFYISGTLDYLCEKDFGVSVCLSTCQDYVKLIVARVHALDVLTHT